MRGGRMWPVHPSSGLADVDCEVGRALDLGDDAHRRHDLAQVEATGAWRASTR
jgi:hypothetical protein